MMLRILDPSSDHLRIVTPHGQPLRNFLKMQRRDVIVYEPGVLLDWGISLMEEALADPRHEQRRLRMRTGLMAAFLSLILLRVRSLLSLELGKSLLQEANGRWRISLSKGQVKNRRELDVYWPACLAGWLERYLTVERNEFLDGNTCDHLWVNSSGHPLSKADTSYHMRAYSAKLFGKEGAFRTHRFRHCLATVAPQLVPEQPAIAPCILNVGARTVAANYDRGSGVLAARLFHKAVENRRAALKEIAARAFARRHRRKSPPKDSDNDP